MAWCSYPCRWTAQEVLRTIAVYLFLVLALRLAGKRELAQLNSFDLVVLLLSNTVQNAGQHDHIQELLERLQRIEAAVTHGHGSGSAR
jgi:hypothetical protein